MVVGDLAVSIPPLPTFQVSQVGQMALGEKLGNNAAAVVLKKERERGREGEREREREREGGGGAMFLLRSEMASFLQSTSKLWREVAE